MDPDKLESTEDHDKDKPSELEKKQEIAPKYKRRFKLKLDPPLSNANLTSIQSEGASNRMNSDELDTTEEHDKDNHSEHKKKQEKAQKLKRRLKLNRDLPHSSSSTQPDGASNTAAQNDLGTSPRSRDQNPYASPFGGRAWHRPQHTNTQLNPSPKGPSISPMSRRRASDDGNQGGGSSRSLGFDAPRRTFDRHTTRQPSNTLRNRGQRQNNSSENPLASSLSALLDISPPRRHQRDHSDKNVASSDSSLSVPDLASNQIDEDSDQDFDVFRQRDGPSLSPGFSDFYSNFIRGLGTEDEPIELSSDSPSSSGSVLSDEVIARQLQEEEWDAANSFGHYSRHSFQDQDSYSPLRRHLRGPSRTLSDTGAGRSFGLLDLGLDHHSRRHGSRHEWGSGRQHTPPQRRPHIDLFNPLSMNSLSDDIASLIFHMFHNYGMSDYEIASMINPGAVGDPAPLRMDYESMLALAERLGEVSRGMSESDINQIPTSKHRSEEEEGGAASTMGADLPQCNICLTDYQHGEEMRNLPCRHSFHVECVDQWLKINATCPVCRTEMKKTNT